MKTRASSHNPVSGKDKLVTTAVAKRDWFLKSSDLATLPRSGGAAAWGVGRFPVYYSVKDLDRLALRVHGGAAGLAKKKAGRIKRLENAKGKMKVAPRRKNGKGVDAEEEEEPEEVEFSGEKKRLRSRSTTKRRWAIEDVIDDSDGDFNPGKETRKKQKTPPKIENAQKQHNLKAVGEWNVVDCDDCYWIELRQKGNGLAGEALVCDCEVALSCNNLYGQDMDFKAIFKTERDQYVGVMTICLNKNDTLSVEYFNGARGVARVEFEATAQRRRIKQKKQ